MAQFIMHGPRLSAQSAMEYLMTYGWAILIIAVVLGALFGLGFFNSANLAPKIAPGACQVYRPNGPGTTSFVNLEGTCNNELPQYVGKFGRPPYSPLSSYMSTGTAGLPLGSSPRSFFVWIYDTLPLSYGSAQVVYSYGAMSANNFVSFYIQPGSMTFNYNSGACGTGSLSSLANNTWMFVGYTYAAGSSQVTLYIDSQSATCSIAAPLNTALPATDISDIGKFSGENGALTNLFNGYIANVQLYNTSFSANEVTALYQEGIGGVPILPQNLVGWWPLNGNANDYSGNLNNGIATNVIYSTSWTSGYTAP